LLHATEVINNKTTFDVDFSSQSTIDSLHIKNQFKTQLQVLRIYRMVLWNVARPQCARDASAKSMLI